MKSKNTNQNFVKNMKMSKEDKEEYDEGGDRDFAAEDQDDDVICELEHLRKLFIGGLSPNTTEDSLKEFYQQWGNVVDVVVMRDNATKRSRGFGFITYSKAYMVDRAQNNRPHTIDGKIVEAKRAMLRPEREKRESNVSVKKLFVGGLKDNHDEECLKEYFSEFGKVVSVRILTDRATGKRRGFAYISYDDYDAVDKAVLKKHHLIKYVAVDVKKSVYDQEKQNRQMQSNSNGGPTLPQPPQQAYGASAPPPQQYGPPPQNYNYWGSSPQQSQPPQYYGYPQQPPTPQMGSWGYSAPPQWNAGPPAPPQQSNWQQPQGQWGPPPAAGPTTGGAPPPQAWNAAPSTVPPPAVGPPPVAPTQAPDFGTGYQQNYGGGPAQHGNNSSNRMNPYVPPAGNRRY